MSTPLLEPTHPYPPRFRWLKRGVVLLVLWITFIAGLRFWGGHEATRRYQALIDSGHDAGQPILPADFDSPPVPPSENAALSLTNAANALVLNNRYFAFDANYLGGPLTKADLQALKTTIAANRKALQLMRHARSQPKVDWGYNFRTPVMTTFPPLGTLQPQRQLANFLYYAALYEHTIGDDREAIEMTRDILRQSEAAEEGPSILVTRLYAPGLAMLAVSRARLTAPDLRVSHGSSDSNPAPADIVQDLIRELLDERTVRQGAMRAWYGERIWCLDTTANFGIGAVLPGQKLFMLEPMVRLDGLRMAVQMNVALKAAAQPDWPAAEALIPNHPTLSGSHLEDITRILSGLWTPGIDRAINSQFHALTDRRAAAIELATRLYRVGNAGQFPPRLDDLVPIYLPSVPLDPMAAGKRPFGYHADSKPPVIYSVGENGIDDGGLKLPSDADSSDRWQTPDAVFPLGPLPPATQPSNGSS